MVWSTQHHFHSCNDTLVSILPRLVSEPNTGFRTAPLSPPPDAHTVTRNAVLFLISVVEQANKELGRRVRSWKEAYAKEVTKNETIKKEFAAARQV